jgi:hypothetical protein
MKNKQILTTIIIALVVGAASFYGGMRYQQMRRGNFAGQFAQGGNFRGANGTGLRGGNGGGFMPVTGEIISGDDKTMTVKLQDGSSKIVILSDSTNINKAEAGSKTDLTPGTKILVLGQTNSDGSVTAQSVQVNPMDRGMGKQGM